MRKNEFNPELDGKGKIFSQVKKKFKPKAFEVGSQMAKAFDSALRKQKADRG